LCKKFQIGLASSGKILYNINNKVTHRPELDLRSQTDCISGGTAMDIIKVSGKSRTSAVAGAIAGVFREQRHAEVQAIGASAINQAVKALALSRNYLAEDGYNVIFVPEFVDVEIDQKVRTAIKFTVEER